jgi:ankyrin repeat protein
MASKLEKELKDPFRKAGADRMVVYSPEVLRSALFNAISEARVEDVKLCVDRGASVDWRDEGDASCGLTTLQAAVCCKGKNKDRLALVKYLLSQKVNVNDIDYVESTALHFCAALGNGDIIDLLIKEGANPNVYDAEALTPLHLAINNGHMSCVVSLLNNWAKVDLSDTDVMDPQEKYEVERIVSVPGASLYLAKRGTPLHVACSTNRVEVAARLIGQGKANINSSKGPHGCTPLHIACRAGFHDMYKLLVSEGANVLARDESGEEPLHRCIEHGSLEIAELLLKNGARGGSPNHVGVTPVHLAAAFARTNLLKTLVKQGGADVDVNSACTKTYDDWDGGRTPLMYAAHNGNIETFRTLVDLGADWRKMSGVGWPALFYAVEANRKEVVEYIVKRDLADGVHVLVDKSRTPLMVAAMHNALESAEVLIKAYPFTVNWQDDMGRTSLHWAAKRSQQEVMKKIVDCGGDIHIRDKNGAVCAELFPNLVKPAPKRQWEEERKGPQGEAVWDYKNVMENTSIRYMKRTMSARRIREIAHERQCNWCKRYSFDAMRCSACKQVYYCSSTCQQKDWRKGGHRLNCITKGLEELVASKVKAKALHCKNIQMGVGISS